MNQQDFLSVHSAPSPLAAGSSTSESAWRAGSGALIVNADDWGRDRVTTDRTLECVIRGTVSSASAMVFMADSERAATLAWEANIDAGLHLNFTTPFSSRNCPAGLAGRQQRITRFLRSSRLAQVVFHPGLMRAFEYVVSAQIDEFRRLYGKNPERVDGHHHMHLCANVLFGGLLPAGAIARRNFTFARGEKSLAQRWYREMIDRRLARRHPLADFFFSLPPLEPLRLKKIFGLARHAAVEVETHPTNAAEYRFLTSGEMFARAGNVEIASRFALPQRMAGSAI